MRRVREFIGSDGGVNSIEYGLIAALVAASLIAAAGLVVDNFPGLVRRIGGGLDGPHESAVLAGTRCAKPDEITGC